MFADCISRMSLRIAVSIGGRPTPLRRLFRRQYRRKPSRCQRTTVSGCKACNIARHPPTYFENDTQNTRSIVDTRGRFTDCLSIASCWRSARFSSANWRRDLKTAPIVSSRKIKQFSMPFMLQEPLGKVNEFKPIRFSGGTGSRSFDHGWLLRFVVLRVGDPRLLQSAVSVAETQPFAVL